jgi:DNA-binding response OmpR family regulator
MGIFDIGFGKKDSEQTNQPPKVDKKILIIEDDQYLRDFYKELLEGEGYIVITADNGKTGYDTIIAEKPNLVMLDIMMPIMDGKQVLHQIRSMPEFKKLPVIVLTNAGTADNIKDMKFYDNADDFVIKSNVEPPEILLKIKSLINVN